MAQAKSSSAAYIAINHHTDPVFLEHKFNSLKFNLHTGSVSSEAVVVFIHGWGGGGYKTWKHFPRMLHDGEDANHPDIAIFSYKSGLITALTRGSKLDADVERLVAGLRELEENYRTVYLVCHSLGGLVGGQAVETYLTRCRLTGGQPSTKISGMFIFASPRAGTGWANPLLAWFIREFYWLRRFSDRAQRIERFFTDYVQSNAVANTLDYKFLIPRFAYLGSADRVVNRFSASFGIPSDQIMTTTGNHRSIVKPKPLDHPQVDWLQATIADMDDLHSQRERELPYAFEGESRLGARNFIVTQLWHAPTAGHYADIYNDVRDEASRGGVLVQDVAETDDAARSDVDLLVALPDASAVLRQDPQAQSMVLEARSRHRSTERITVGVAPVGDEHVPATAIVNDWLVSDPPVERFYVEGAANPDDLRDLMWRWIQRIIRRNPHRIRRQAGALDSLVGADTHGNDYFGRTDYQ